MNCVWDAIAALVLFLQLPIPFFWFIVHPKVDFWRRHQKAGYTIGLGVAWTAVAMFLVLFRRALFAQRMHPWWEIFAGVVLFILDGFIFSRVRRDLGTSRLIGQPELEGGGEMASTGIYALVRHPRYTGMMAAVAGACLIAGTRWMWLSAAVWWMLAFLAILLEERELRARFGAAYEEYSRRVPRFLPLRLGPRAG